jgi:LacI family transcriptional regulator, gluconate utilization system Gnt-I transcriptional repressor
MADVAREAGVSMINVSRMLREPDKVTQQTRVRIEQAMAEVGYVPNLVAGGLAATRTQVVAAIVPYIQHGVFADAVQGLSDALSPAKHCVLLGNSGGSTAEEEAIVRTLLGHRPAGLVIQGANHSLQTRKLLERAQIPVVEMGTLPESPIDCCVGYSNTDAAYAMTLRLVQAGRRRIGFVCAHPAGNDRHALRLAGYRAALDRMGPGFDPRLVVETDFGIRQGGEAMRHLLGIEPKLDAVFCASDLWAAGAVYECNRRGLAVPDAVAICGFNDQEFAAEMIPALTTIRVRRHEIGFMAGNLILARIEGREIETRIDVGFELIERQSG